MKVTVDQIVRLRVWGTPVARAVTITCPDASTALTATPWISRSRQNQTRLETKNWERSTPISSTPAARRTRRAPALSIRAPMTEPNSDPGSSWQSRAPPAALTPTLRPAARSPTSGPSMPMAAAAAMPKP